MPQWFPFYEYDEDGSNRRENITDWALNQFRTHYSDPNITKWDIFHYVYAVLHHPEYRERYAANLKRELPRIPFVGASLSGSAGLQAGVSVASFSNGAGLQPGDTGGSPGLQAGDKNGAEGASSLPKASAQPQAERPKEIFRAFADAGKRLADLHVSYEQQPEYPLERVEKGQLNWRVEKIRLSKDKTTLVYNEFLTLKGIPPETYEYRLGNRSALEWVIDQYQVSTDKRSGITNDPNRADDPEYIVRLIGQVITVSLETKPSRSSITCPKASISRLTPRPHCGTSALGPICLQGRPPPESKALSKTTTGKPPRKRESAFPGHAFPCPKDSGR